MSKTEERIEYVEQLVDRDWPMLTEEEKVSDTGKTMLMLAISQCLLYLIERIGEEDEALKA